jgi:DNA-binding XRE family transcriptional regulator
MSDALDVFIAEQQHDPVFADAYEDAEARAALLRSLVEQRKARGLSQSQVAERMGTTQSAVSDLESGGSDPRLSTLQRYARAVNAAIRLGLVGPRGGTIGA